MARRKGPKPRKITYCEICKKREYMHFAWNGEESVLLCTECLEKLEVNNEE